MGHVFFFTPLIFSKHICGEWDAAERPRLVCQMSHSLVF